MAFWSKLLPRDQEMLLVFISSLSYSTCKQRSQESKPLLSSCFVLMHHTNWMDDMKEVETLKAVLEADDDKEREARTEKYVINPVPEEGLRYRRTAVGEYREVEALRLQDVKRNTKAKVMRMKIIRPCHNCAVSATVFLTVIAMMISLQCGILCLS